MIDRLALPIICALSASGTVGLLIALFGPAQARGVNAVVIIAIALFGFMIGSIMAVGSERS